MLGIYDIIYHSSFYHGHRGLLINALYAVDITLYDLTASNLETGLAAAGRRPPERRPPLCDPVSRRH